MCLIYIFCVLLKGNNVVEFKPYCINLCRVGNESHGCDYFQLNTFL